MMDYSAQVMPYVVRKMSDDEYSVENGDERRSADYVLPKRTSSTVKSRVREAKLSEDTKFNSPKSGLSENGNTIKPTTKTVNTDVQTKTSIRLFREFIVTLPDGTLDASAINSSECYEAWLASRKQTPPEPEKAFQRTLSSHLTSVDGRIPFTPEEEAAVLRVLRKKERWPCFAHCSIRFGHTGFRALGFHEKRTLEAGNARQGVAVIRAERKRQQTSYKLKDDDDDEEVEWSEEHARQSRGKGDSRSNKLRKKSRISHASSDDTSAVTDLDDAVTVQEIMNGMVDDESPRAPAGSHRPHDPAYDIPSPSDVKLISIAKQMFGNVANITLEVWHKFASVARMMLLATGWFKRPVMEDAIMLMRAVEREHPHEAILLVDLTCSDFLDRFMLQNDVSRRYIGAVSRQDGGFRGRIFAPEDVWRAIMLVVGAFRSRGQHEVNGRVSLICLGNIAVPFNCHAYADPSTGLLVLRGHPISHLVLGS